MAFYPAFLDLRARRVVVIGGGAVAEQKVIGLLEAGARVTVVSPETTARLDELADTRAIEIRRRPYRAGDLAGARLAIAATDDRTVNRAVWAEAEWRGVLLNAVDDLPHCSFIAPAIHREGDITVAVSTGGKSPALAVRVRDRIARSIGAAEARLCDLLGEVRPELVARVPDARVRTALWYRIVDSDVVEFVRRGDVAGARRRIGDLLDEVGRPDETGIVYLVGAGPGDPGLITLRGLEILRSADVVAYDRLVHPALLSEAPPQAERVCVGKHPRGTRARQQDINAVLIDRARQGCVVVRLKGGDPFVFGRGAEEWEVLAAAGVRVQVVPGVSSAIAAPGASGIPVTHRRHASAFAVVTGHECDGASDLDWDAVARMPTLVVPMGLATLPAQRTVVGTLATIAEPRRPRRVRGASDVRGRRGGAGWPSWCDDRPAMGRAAARRGAARRPVIPFGSHPTVLISHVRCAALSALAATRRPRRDDRRARSDGRRGR